MNRLSLRSVALTSFACCLALFVAGEAHAQMKVGVVDLQLALESVKEGKAAKDRLDKMVKDKQKELDTKTEKVKKMEDDIQKQLPLLDEKGKKDLLEKYRKEMMDLQKLYVDNQTFLQKKRAELLEPLLKKMSKRREGGGWFPWKISSLLLVAGIVYVLRHDVDKHGSFEGIELEPIS